MDERLTEYLRDDMIALVLNKIKPDMVKMNYDLQKRYDDIVMLCRQCFGYDDETMLTQLKTMLFELVDDMNEEEAISNPRKYEYILKVNSHVSEDVLLVALSRKYDCTKIDADRDAELVVLFRQVWLSGKITPAVSGAMRDFLNAADNFAATIVTYAIMLRCVRYYDNSLIRLLFDLNTAEAFVALAVIMICKSERIAYDQKEKDMFAEFIRDENNARKLTWTLCQIVNSYETERITREFEQKIYPEVARQRQNLDIDQMLSEGKKPDWEGMLEGSSLIGKLRKINDLQLSGKDVNFATFKAMKNYPFFSETSHWFYPFIMGYRDFGDIKGAEDRGIEVLSKAANLCDSDRYSLFLMLKAMGINDMGVVLGGMGVGNINDLEDMVDEKWQENGDQQFKLRIRYAVLNIYRFYNLAPNHSDFCSPFEFNAMHTYSLEQLCQILPAEIVHQIADAAFNVHNYPVAQICYEKCEEQCADTDTYIYEKMGLCYVKETEFEKAIEYYDKADILQPDNVGILTGLADCYYNIGNDQMEIKTRRRISVLNPNDMDNLYYLSDALINCQLYDEALQLLFKCEYESPKTLYEIPIARTLFFLRRYDEADRYFEKVFETMESEAGGAMMAAINNMMSDGKTAEQYLRYNSQIINNAEDFVQQLCNQDISEMLAVLDDTKRNRLNNIINKIVIDL